MPLHNSDHEASHGCIDQVLRALSNTYRRRILIALMTDNPRRQEEFEEVEFESTGAGKETITIELHHSHLPHLDEAEFIDWERTTGQITRGEDFEKVRPLLELMDDHRDELPYNWP